MRDTIFGRNNPNFDLFNVPTEEGGDDEDTMCAMIGDAVARHVATLNPAQRQAWEHYVLNGNKDIFSFRYNPKHNDADELNLVVEDLDTEEGASVEAGSEEQATSDREFEQIAAKLRENRPDLAELHREVLNEAIEFEKERRARSSDAYDRATELIPYQDWEENPSQFSHFDMPTTPKQIPVYCGNSNQMFYDEFPEDHPDARLINQYLMMVNKEDIELTTQYGEFMLTWLKKQDFRDEAAYKVLVKLTQYLVDGQFNAEDVTKKALAAIDESGRKIFVTQVREKLAQDAMYQLMVHKQVEWDTMHDEGVTVLPVIKAFGQTLFTKFRKGMKRHHWDYYRKLKTKYTIPVMVRGSDVNNCTLAQLAYVMNVNRATAIDIWMNRPFTNVNELTKHQVSQWSVELKDGKLVRVETKVMKGWVNREDLGEKGDVEVLYTLIKTKAKDSREARDIRVLSALSQELIKRQKEAKDYLSPREWGSVWSLYRAEKNAILKDQEEKR